MGGFTEIASRTGETEVVGFIRASWVNMLNMHGLPNDFLARLTVFTAVVGSFMYQTNGCCP